MLGIGADGGEPEARACSASARLPEGSRLTRKGSVSALVPLRRKLRRLVWVVRFMVMTG